MKKKLNVGKVVMGLAVVAIIGGGFYAVSLQQSTDIRSQAAKVNPVSVCTSACKQVKDKTAKGRCSLGCREASNSEWNCLKNLCENFSDIKTCDLTCGKMANISAPKGYAIRSYKSKVGERILTENQELGVSPAVVSTTQLIRGSNEIIITEEPAGEFTCGGVEKILGSTTACMEDVVREGLSPLRVMSYLDNGMKVKISMSDPKINDTELTRLVETFKVRPIE